MKWAGIQFLRPNTGSIAASTGAGHVVRIVVVCLVIAFLFGVIAYDARDADPLGGSGDGPKPADDGYDATAGQDLLIDAPGVLGNDDGKTPLTAKLVTTTAHGSLTLNPDGSFAYAPDNDFLGVDSFVYRSRDGASAEQDATVSITVGTDPTYRCVKLVALSEVNGKPGTSAAELSFFDAQGAALDNAGWSVRSVDSEELVAANGAAANAIDGDPKTIWATQWKGGRPGHPHQIELDLGRPQVISRLGYLPRQGTRHLNGTIQKYEVFVSHDCDTWQLAARGLWPATDALKTVVLGETSEGVALPGGIEPEYVASNLYDIELGKLEGPFGRRYGGLATVGDDVIVATGAGKLYLALKENGYGIEKLPYRVPTNVEDFDADFEALTSGGSFKDSFGVKDIFARRREGATELFATYHHWDPDRHCGTLRLSRMEFRHPSPSSEGPGDWELLFETAPCLPFKKDHVHPFAGHQSGGRIWVGADDRILLTVGDHEFDGENTKENYPQHPTASYGKTYEIDLQDKNARIFSLGHRNAQGLYIDPEGAIWSTEHGPKGGDELNLLTRGGNYGWPTVTYGTDYDAMTWPLSDAQGSHAGYLRPFFAWVPSIGISNLIGVEKSLFDLWQGDLLVASLGWKKLYRLRLRDGRVMFSEPIHIGQRIRDLAELDDGTIVLKTDANGDPTKSYMIFMRPSDRALAQDGHGDPPTHFAKPVKDGQIVALRCAGCHTLGQGEEHRLGPNLWNIVGQKIGAAPGYAYSAALANAGGRWTAKRLDRFLKDPKTFIKGTKMQFSGIADAEDREFRFDRNHSRILSLTAADPRVRACAGAPDGRRAAVAA
jgi:VCBS repeat-containing protein